MVELITEKMQLTAKVGDLEKKVLVLEGKVDRLQNYKTNARDQRKGMEKQLESFSAERNTLVLGQVAFDVEKRLLELADIEENNTINSVMKDGLDDDPGAKTRLEEVLKQHKLSSGLRRRLKYMKFARLSSAHPDISTRTTKELKVLAKDLDVKEIKKVFCIIDLWKSLQE